MTSLTDAARLAQQATFGPTPDLVNKIAQMGVKNWLDDQFAATGSKYDDIAAATAVKTNYCSSPPGSLETACFTKYNSRTLVATRFYADAMNSPDQLRQRVALALSEILVTSELEVSYTSGIAAYQQILLNGAFGNYRDILANITLNGLMGNYLDMADSNKTAPSENYARELLQLFSMGADQLNMDGTVKTDSSGGALPNYTTDDIKEVARALTGWTFARLNGAPITDSTMADFSKPMIQVPARYDSAAKSVFGTSVAAGASQDDSVKAVVDAAFNHPSTAPFVSRLLIQNLVMSNPSPAYIGRVAAVFANNGAGVRGDMKAVIRAILMDSEARTPSTGKMKEPILALVALARAMGMTTDGVPFPPQDLSIGQPVFRAGSVFNFFPPNYPLAGSTTLYSPPSKLLTTANFMRMHNLFYTWTVEGDRPRPEFTANTFDLPGFTGTTLQLGSWEALGTDTGALVDRVNLLMTANAMTDAQKTALSAALSAITDANPTLQTRKRAQMALYIVGTSPLFLSDR